MTNQNEPCERLRERRWQIGFETRADDDGGGVRVAGYAAVYGETADIGGFFTEEIKAGAFSASVERGDLVQFLIEHRDLPLASTGSGTLILESDTRGLRMETSLEGSDPDVQRIIPKMERGDLDKMSVGFYALRDEWDYDRDPVHRTIIEAELFDVSIVSRPAYEQTEIALRSALEAEKRRVAVRGRHEKVSVRARIMEIDSWIARIKYQ